jgi:hypothetical protein
MFNTKKISENVKEKLLNRLDEIIKILNIWKRVLAKVFEIIQIKNLQTMGEWIFREITIGPLVGVVDQCWTTKSLNNDEFFNF